MPGVPLDGPTPEQSASGGPAHEAMAAMLAGTEPRKVGLFGRIMGQKHQQNLREDENKAKFIMDTLHDVATNPNNQLPDETVDWLVSQAGSIMGKDTGTALKQHFEQLRAAKALEQRRAMLPQQQGQGQAPPAMSQPAPAPANMSTGPTAAGGIPLKPMGLPSPPAEGAPAGPAPQQQQPSPVAEMVTGAAKGGTGFGGPPAPSGGSFFRKSAVQAGVDIAATERPQLEGKAQVAREQAAQDYEALKARYAKEPWFEGLTDRQKAEVLSHVNISAEPHFNIPGVTMSQAGDVDLNGEPVAVGVPGRRTFMNGQWAFTPENGRLQFKEKLNEDGTKSWVPVNAFTGKAGEVDPNLTSAARVRTVRITLPDGTTNEMGVTATGHWASNDPRFRGVNPAMLTNESNNFKLVPQSDGTTALVPVTTTTGKVPARMTPPPAGASIMGPPAPGAPAPRGNPRIGTPVTVGGKSLTPGQRATFDSKLSAFNNTIDLAKSVKDNLGLLGSLIDSKKIDMQIDPQQGIIKALINRSLPMTDKEVKLAGDFASLMEHINTLRGPLAATGFRGHEAWAALQAQRGQLLANPRVTSVVLENTLKALTGQRDVLKKALEGKVAAPEWANGMPEPPAGIPAPPGQSAQLAANPNPSGYVVGHKYGGLTYQGGDPNNKASWK